MEARKLLYAGLVLTPALALAGIGLHSRTYVDTFEWPHTATDQKRVSAYLDIVRDTREHVTFVSTADHGQMRRLAHRWIDESAKGSLKPLIPVAYDDMLVSGAKSQIFNSMVMLNRGLVHSADRFAQEGDIPNAVEDLLLSIETAETLKYSNFMIVYRCSMLQHSAVNRLQDIWEMLSDAERAKIRKKLSPICKGVEPLTNIASHARKLYFAAVQTQEDAELALETADRMIPSRSFFEQPALAKTRPKYAKHADVISPTLVLADLNSDATRSMETEKYLEAKIRRFLTSK